MDTASARCNACRLSHRSCSRARLRRSLAPDRKRCPCMYAPVCRLRSDLSMIVLHEALCAPPCNTLPPLSMHARKLRYDVSIDANAQRAMASNTITQHKVPNPVLDIDHLSVQGPDTLEAMTLDLQPLAVHMLQERLQLRVRALHGDSHRSLRVKGMIIPSGLLGC